MKARPKIERETILFLLIFFVTGVFLFYLFNNQILNYSQWSAAAKSQSTTSNTVQAQRGEILAQDKSGNLYTLALSVWQYNISISPREVPDKQKLVNALASIIPNMNSAAVLSDINNNNVYVPPVITGLDQATAQKIENANLTGVFVTPTLTREYPDGSTIAPQDIGFVGNNGEGVYGVEATHNSELTGTSGDQNNQVDSLGRLINVLSTKPP